jgi:phage terminase small subunit
MPRSNAAVKVVTTSKTTTKKAKKARSHLQVVTNHHSNGMPQAKLERYSAALLRSIKRELATAVFFTREDLIHLELFGFVGHQTRYKIVRECVKYLDKHGDLIAKNRTDICLRGEHEKAYNSDTPLYEQHYDTICSIVGSMPVGSRVTVMDIMAEWKTDPQLTENNKRVAVRGAMPHLIKEDYLKRRNDFEYIVLKVS